MERPFGRNASETFGISEPIRTQREIMQLTSTVQARCVLLRKTDVGHALATNWIRCPITSVTGASTKRMDSEKLATALWPSTRLTCHALSLRRNFLIAMVTAWRSVVTTIFMNQRSVPEPCRHQPRRPRLLQVQASPTTSPSPSPSPTCDPNTKPNPSNCTCEDNGRGGVDWACGCPDGSDGADYIHILTNYGCPPNKHNVSDCCECIDQNHTCPSGCHWDTSYCQCVDFLGSPCSAPTPTTNTNLQPGGSGSSDPSKSGSCTEYWWVYSESYDGGVTWHEIWSTPAGCW